MAFAWLALGVGCAEIVGLTGDYYEVGPSPGGRGGVGGAQGGVGKGGDPGGDGGFPTGGTVSGAAGDGGTAGDATGGRPEGGTGGSAGDGSGTGGEPAGGDAGTGGGGSGGGGSGGDSGSGGSGPTRPSCEDGLSRCGPNGNIDCCISNGVPGGEFDRINDTGYPATVSSFLLDRYEVTVARFRHFEAEFHAGYRPRVGDGKNPNDPNDEGWQSSFTAALPADRIAMRSALACHYHATWTDDDQGGNEERPINCVSWYTAFAFCIRDGGRLPTEAEWNYAAAGGDEQRVYPWSDPPVDDTIGVDHASYNSMGALECCGDYTVGCEVTDFIKVGTRVDGYGAFGHAELSGNVYEWTRDAFAAVLPMPCDDCANLADDTRHVIRGGCYSNHEGLLRTTFRLDWLNDEESSGIGIRCARAPDP
jgi:formylglycine-generating enzyme required for sulfatase activity